MKWVRIALKVRSNIAQGNALGHKNPLLVSPCKGRIKRELYCPFRA